MAAGKLRRDKENRNWGCGAKKRLKKERIIINNRIVNNKGLVERETKTKKNRRNVCSKDK